MMQTCAMIVSTARRYYSSCHRSEELVHQVKLINERSGIQSRSDTEGETVMACKTCTTTAMVQESVSVST